MITILRVWECKWKSTNTWQILLEAEQLIYCLFHHNEQEKILGGSTRALNYSMAHMDMEENWKKNHTQTHIQRKRHTERERESAATKHSKLKRQNATKLNKQSHLKITLTLIERERENKYSYSYRHRQTQTDRRTNNLKGLRRHGSREKRLQPETWLGKAGRYRTSAFRQSIKSIRRRHKHINT